MCSAPQKQNVLVLLPESNEDLLITNVHRASNGTIYVKIRRIRTSGVETDGLEQYEQKRAKKAQAAERGTMGSPFLDRRLSGYQFGRVSDRARTQCGL